MEFRTDFLASPKCSGLSRLWHLPSVSLLPWDSSRLTDLKDYNVINKLWEMCVASSDIHTGTHTQRERLIYRNSHIDTYTCTHTYTNKLRETHKDKHTLSDTQRNKQRLHMHILTHVHMQTSWERHTNIHTHMDTQETHIHFILKKKGWLNKSLEKIFVDEKAI